MTEKRWEDNTNTVQTKYRTEKRWEVKTNTVQTN